MGKRVWHRLWPLGLMVLFGTGCAITVPGKTGASPVLKADTVRALLMMDITYDRDCKERKVIDTEVVEIHADGRAVERWTLDRCGKGVPYRVTYTPSPGGGTFYKVMPW